VDADFSGLNRLTANLGTGFFRLGDVNSGTEVNPSTFRLAVNNTLTAAQIRIGDGAGGSNLHTLTLGSGSNVLNADTFNIGSAGTGIRSSGAVVFDGLDTTGTLTLRAANGTDRALLNMVNSTGNTGADMSSLLNLDGHTADLLVSTLTMASRTTNSGAAVATLNFNQGTLDVTTLTMASRTGTGTGGATATANFGDSAAPGIPTVTVGTLNMATNTSAGGTVTANLNVTGGNVTLGTGSGTAINMANAAASRAATSNINLTGGSVTLAGNVIRQGGAGTETATLTLDGASLNMGGFNLGTSTAPVTFAARSGSLSHLAELNGGGLLTKSTTGALELGNGNTYTGGTTVALGTLLVNNTTGSGTGTGPVSVLSGGTLGGSGTLSGATTILGTHSPGNSPGIQTFGSNLTYGDGFSTPQVVWELAGNSLSGRGTLFDGVDVGGNLAFVDPTTLKLVFNGTGSTVDWTNSLWTSSQSWLLYQVTGSTTGLSQFNIFTENWKDANDVEFDTQFGGLWGFNLSQTGSDVYLNFVVIPEPSRALLTLLGLMVLGWRRRRS
jgi:autotransporter-associated beta strand protein